MVINVANNGQLNINKKQSVFNNSLKNQNLKNQHQMGKGQFVKNLPQKTELSKSYDLKKQLKQGGNNSSNMPKNSVLESSKSYLDSLRASRTKSKDAALSKKKIRYSFKALSSKIVNCKRSHNAKEVASQAKREIARLKRLRTNGEYDSEELEAAISHAQSMERIAKKKARHLEEEEMVKTSGGVCLDQMEEKENAVNTDDSDDISNEESAVEEQYSDEQLAPDSIDIDYEDFDIDDIDSMAMMEEMMDEMSQELADLSEELGLSDLLDDLGMSADKDMDPADFKMMVIKHRNKEMKDITEADGIYLKTMFERLERLKSGGSPMPSANAVNTGVSSEAMPAAQIANATPAISIDVSV